MSPMQSVVQREYVTAPSRQLVLVPDGSVSRFAIQIG